LDVTLEERIAKLEQSLAVYRALAIAVTVLLAGFFGYNSFYQIPKAANDALKDFGLTQLKEQATADAAEIHKLSAQSGLVRVVESGQVTPADRLTGNATSWAISGFNGKGHWNLAVINVADHSQVEIPLPVSSGDADFVTAFGDPNHRQLNWKAYKNQ
jgi:hypothetical protein